MQKLGFILIAAAMLTVGVLAGARAEALGVAPAGARAAIEASSAVETIACREKRWGWHGWGWYPCKEPAVNTCEKCRWRWGYKYCWKVC